MTEKEFKVMSIKEFTKAAEIYDSGHAGVYEMCKADDGLWEAGKFVMRFIFRSAKEHPDECEATKKDVDRRLSAALHEWITV